MSFDLPSTSNAGLLSTANEGGEYGGAALGIFPRRAMTLGGGVPPTPDDSRTHTLTVYLHAFNPESGDRKLKLEFGKRSTTEDLIETLIERLSSEGSSYLLSSGKNTDDFEVYEAMGTLDGRTLKERRLDSGEYPVTVQTLWPRAPSSASIDDPSVPQNRFVLRRKGSRHSVGHAGQLNTSSTIDAFLAKFLQQPQDREYADLCLLPELTEQTLLDNLKDRFNSGHIYTYIGPILVAVNPFSFFPIYNPKYSMLYCQSRRLGALPPHIFAVADVTYHNMMRIKQNQCVVISGESGSGKTESTNFLLHHLSTLSQKGGTGSTVEQMLLSAGPVLEAFGNAVTVQNNNSSRFGKFIKVNYRENGIVSGANVEIYLLEKSRIISQAVGERNYHVFYYLLEGASEEERERHFLLEPNGYHYLHCEQNTFIASETVNERYEFERLKQSMSAVGFSEISQQMIFGVISAVLLLGNVEYLKRPGYHSDESAFIGNEELIGIISGLLNIRTQQLTQALTMRKTVLKHDTVINRYTVSEAINTRDAIAKCLYNALFHWIVLRINHALIKKETTMGRPKDKGFFIGILDIFGFEDVGGQWNSFEQLCINYANEHLQAYFNQHIFQFEQEEYLKEGIQWTNIEWTDNRECLQFFQNKPYGLWRLIDEESNINNATDKSMLEKLNTFLKANEYYEVPHKREDAFIVAHYAGKVKYQIAGFREKNKDQMRTDVMAVLKGSRSSFLREVLGDDPVAVYRWALVRSVIRAFFAFRGGAQKRKIARRAESVDRLLPPNAEPANALSRRASESHLNAFLRGELQDKIPEWCDTSMFPTIVNRARKTPIRQQSERQSHLRSLQAVKELIGRRPTSGKPTSVSKQFEHSLSRLMKTLAQACPYFIRCIKSNNEKIPNHFDDNIILRQLRYTGMLETVRIRRAGYSVRIEYEAFKQQYRMLLPKGVASVKEDIQEFISNHPLIEAENLQYGNTKIFMRDAEKLLLDDHLHRMIMDHIHTIQCWFRSLLARRRYLRLLRGVIRLQALARGVAVRSQLRRRAMAALCVQCWWRKTVALRRYQLIRNAIIALQARAKGMATRKGLGDIRANAMRSKRFGALPPEFGKVERMTTIQLARFDLNDPSTLAAYADDEEEDSFIGAFDSATDISSGEDFEDADELIAGTIIEEERGEDGGEEAGDTFPTEGQHPRFPRSLNKRFRRAGRKGASCMDNDQSDEIGLDATFILENARMKLIGETESYLNRRQSLATTTTAAGTTRHPTQLRRAASTDSDQLKELLSGQVEPITGMPHSRQPPSRALDDHKSQGTFVKARRQLKALLTGRPSVVATEHSVGGSSTLISEGTDVASRRSESADIQLVAKCHGHSFKMSRLHRSECCALCNRPLGGLFVAQGYRCGHCKLCFHKECCNFAINMPCTPPVTSPTRSESTPIRKPWEAFKGKSSSMRQSRSSPKTIQPRIAVTTGLQGTFSLIGKAKQQTDSSALLIETTEDLRQFSVFIFKKQSRLEQEKKGRETAVDSMFKRSLREFHMELIGMEAVLTEGSTVLKYRDLIATFEGLLTKLCNEEHITFPTTLGVNAFRGFLNEFMQQRGKRKHSSTRTSLMKSVRKKRRRSDITLHNGHRFMADVVHVPTYCEMCNVFMWHAEKIFICVNCHLSVHKRCHAKVSHICSKASKRNITENARFFGAELSQLIDEEHELPAILNKLLIAVEVKALFVEGIYRKSGALAAIKATRMTIETSEPHTVEFNETPVHVLTSLVKAFFRELPEPLITYELYENFVNVSEVKEASERVRCLRAMIDLLPKNNKCLLDRLMYHLARIAHQETVNRMSCSNLAVIFAPCILRRSQAVHAQEQLMDVQRQSLCLQTLIEEKLRQYCETLNQIVELENASEKVSENLRKIDEHRRSSGSSQEIHDEPPKSQGSQVTTAQQTPTNLQLPQQAAAKDNSNVETARQLFEEQLDFLDREKDKLIKELPPLSAGICPVASSEDSSLASAEDEAAPEETASSEPPVVRTGRTKMSIGSVISMLSQEEFAIDFHTPPIISRLPNLSWALRKKIRKTMAGQRIQVLTHYMDRANILRNAVLLALKSQLQKASRGEPSAVQWRGNKLAFVVTNYNELADSATSMEEGFMLFGAGGMAPAPGNPFRWDSFTVEAYLVAMCEMFDTDGEALLHRHRGKTLKSVRTATLSTIASGCSGRRKKKNQAFKLGIELIWNIVVLFSTC